MTNLNSRPARQTTVLLVAAALGLPISLAAASPATAQNADCQRASTPVERAICATPRLTALDRQIAQKYAAQTRAMTPANAQVLRLDQRAFLDARDGAVANMTGAELVEELTRQLSGRLEWLTSLRNDPLSDVIGRWRSLNGEITIIQWSTGVVTFAAQTVDTPRNRWVCDAQGDGERTADGAAQFRITSSDSSAWALTVQRKGATLEVQEHDESGDGRPPYCGSAGSIAGTYFQAVPTPDPSR